MSDNMSTNESTKLTKKEVDKIYFFFYVGDGASLLSFSK